MWDQREHYYYCYYYFLYLSIFSWVRFFFSFFLSFVCSIALNRFSIQNGIKNTRGTPRSIEYTDPRLQRQKRGPSEWKCREVMAEFSWISETYISWGISAEKGWVVLLLLLWSVNVFAVRVCFLFRLASALNAARSMHKEALKFSYT